jgi:aspartate carbamoyltransferase catalytic subunit
VQPSLKKALSGADVVIALRIQKERHGTPLIPSYQEYHRFFGLNPDLLLKYLSKGGILMHPGPINWGIELAPEVENFSGQVILDQVENGVAIRMAVLLTLLTENKNEDLD